MIGSRPLRVWARDSRVSTFLLAWALLATLYCVHLSTLTPASSSTSHTAYPADDSREGAVLATHLRSMHELVSNKAVTAERGLGYEYESGRRCPYKWHGGSPTDSPRGSCWCGLDSYCMCTPSLAIDAIIEVTGGETNADANANGESDTLSLVLVHRRDPPKDRYAIPGGFVDVGESVEAAVRREVRVCLCLCLCFSLSASASASHTHANPLTNALTTPRRYTKRPRSLWTVAH